MGYYIGIDGGGTKTEYALFDAEKNIITDVKGPGSNHENLEGSFDEAAKYIWDGITSLLKEAGKSLDDVDYTLMGLAGIDHQFQHDEMYSRLEKYGLKNFSIYNDGFIVVKAGSLTGAAIGYNCGTGTCCNSIDNDGKMLQLAGLGDFSGDVGNGHWIATTAYRLIYDDLYLGLEKTALTQLIFKKRGYNSSEEFLASVSLLDSDDSEGYIRDLIDAFFEAAELGDKPVLDTVEYMAERGSALIAAHVNRLNFEGECIEVVLSGSIHTKLPSKIYTDLLKQKTAQRTDRRFNFIVLDKPPVTGCVNWILQEYV
ncbi:MAG: hypothetical protein K5756_00505 [Clostridiales bacterium]|nr:hypothetical protein [Clostridiales bacterium]